jgi:hypothetical protein
MKQTSIISDRVRLTRLLEQVPDEWLEAVVPLLIVLVACLRRFFAAAGDAHGRLASGVPLGTHAVGTGTPISGIGLQWD